MCSNKSYFYANNVMSQVPRDEEEEEEEEEKKSSACFVNFNCRQLRRDYRELASPRTAGHRDWKEDKAKSEPRLSVCAGPEKLYIAINLLKHAS
jgi:hypothetical protein